MRFAFLDIEGVIINEEDALSCPGKRPTPGLPRINVLNRILRETGAKIVVISYLRYGETAESLARMFNCWGVVPDSVYDRTISTREEIRGEEIREWIDRYEREHEPMENYVVIDDEISDMREFFNCIVQPDTSVGLTEEQADQAIAILMRGAGQTENSSLSRRFGYQGQPSSKFNCYV
jgi:hypothetical protein